MEQNTYFPVKQSDIEILERNGCRAENWSTVLVSPAFDATKVRDVILKGEVKIGSLRGEVEVLDGIHKDAGISRATLDHVDVGDNCYISNVHVGLANLNIETGVAIENVGWIACTGKTTFGNGHQVSSLNESGGRELKMTNKTSAQIAYLSVLYRDHESLINNLNKIVDDYCDSVQNTKGFIGKNARIVNCNEIVNVYVAEFARLNGVISLKNGTVDSSSEAPTEIGNGVIAEHFIFQKGSSVKDSAMIFSSLIGEGTQVGKLFSSENSLFFANSECFLSEACSVFGGPYSVTHHKSTLLIAGLFSFFNAGSGTNQSNHMYKLGPVHQGILERGCKTGSYSYLVWPSKVGAFSVIIGKHYANFDTSDLPFSYINEVDGKSTILPAFNFFTTGTFRDSKKWHTRDKRKSSKKLDLITFNVLSPFSVQKAIKGQKILVELAEKSEREQDYIFYKGIRIKRLLLKTANRYYKMIIEKYFGDVLVNRIKREQPQNFKDILRPGKNAAHGDQEWVDVCGLICPKSRIDNLIDQIVSGKINTFEQLHKSFEKIHQLYQADEWNWFLSHYKKINNCELVDESVENIKKLIDQWKDSSIKILNMVLQDAQKEFEGNVKIGFGIGGNSDADFMNVRGRFEDNPFIIQIKKDIEKINRTYDEIAKIISS